MLHKVLILNLNKLYADVLNEQHIIFVRLEFLFISTTANLARLFFIFYYKTYHTTFYFSIFFFYIVYIILYTLYYT